MKGIFLLWQELLLVIIRLLVFVPDIEGTGVVAIPLAPENIAETATGSFIIDQEVAKMKYPTPTLDKLPDASLSAEMIELLDEHMDRDLMSPQLKEVWKDLHPGFDPNRLTIPQVTHINQDNAFDI